MSDLCFTCQHNTSKLLRAANLPEEEKCVQAQQAHLNLVKMERELYRNVMFDKLTQKHDVAALSAKDLDWSRENLSAGMNQESGNTKKKKDIKPAAAHPKQKLNCIKKIVENSDESQEVIGLLHQQLAKRTEECHDLRLRLENIEAVTTQILGNQMEMKDHFVKLLEKLQASVSKIEHRMSESDTNVNREGRLDGLEEQLSVNHCNLLDSPVLPAWADETPMKVREPLHDIQDLSTIDFTTLDDLHEDNQATPRVHQASASQEVGEDLISQCVTPTRVKSIKTALSRPELGCKIH
ncbi:hypothetical protein P5673_030482 [Acropora cervicornis]|uniref:Uncharacterized protein n=1 Tax=Acropora cervicornis TaxID=6130 RepID=A0AAD9UT70_ACRCE|nr:hypothetical protein P5673_030482 [Acropora cervicornis]